MGVRKVFLAGCLMVVSGGFGCARDAESGSGQPDGFRVLFDGTSFSGWRGVGRDSIPSAHWVIEDGMIRKVASGAAETVPLVQVSNLARMLRWLAEQDVRIIGLCGDGEASLYDTALTGPLALVLGGEGKGLRRLTRDHCTALAALPMRGAIESLNVSVAAGICLYEALRQRMV